MLPDGRIEMNEPPGWGVNSGTTYLSSRSLDSLPNTQYWTLVRTRTRGQTVSVMLMNQDIPNPAHPTNRCVHSNYINNCKYANAKNNNVVPYCPVAFPHIGEYMFITNYVNCTNVSLRNIELDICLCHNVKTTHFTVVCLWMTLHCQFINHFNSFIHSVYIIITIFPISFTYFVLVAICTHKFKTVCSFFLIDYISFSVFRL